MWTDSAPTTAAAATATVVATATGTTTSVRGRRRQIRRRRQTSGCRVPDLLLRQRAQAKGDRSRQVGRERQTDPLEHPPRSEYLYLFLYNMLFFRTTAS